MNFSDSEIVSNVLEESVKSSSNAVDSISAASYLSDVELVGLVFFLCFLGLIGFLENLLVILSMVLGDGYLEVPANIFLLSLACADLLICGVSAPLLAYNCFHWIFTIFISVSKFIVVATVGSIFLVTLNRLISIVRPLRCLHILTVQRAQFMVAAIWAVATLVIISAIISFYSGIAWLAHITKYFLTFYIFSTFAMYIYMYALSRRHRKLIRENTYAVTGRMKGALREFRSLRTLVMVVGTCVACWLPMTIAFFFTNRWTAPRQFYRTFTYTGPLVLVNAFIDPIIYYYRSRGFRFTLKILSKRFEEYLYQ